MAQINDQGQSMSWQNLGLDKYLRPQSAPILYDTPVTQRDVLGGALTIQQSGNVMPQAISRDKLAPDATIFPLTVNVGSSIIQAATGYVSALNSYVFVATWDTVNYKIIRFNTVNLLAPYQDAYILNTGIGLAGTEAVSSIDSISVTDDNVIVGYTTDAGNKYAALLDFDLNYVSRMRAPMNDLSLTLGADYDGKLLNSLCNMSSGGGIDAQQIVTGTSVGTFAQNYPTPGYDLVNGTYPYQTFKTGPSTTKIVGISFFLRTPAGNSSQSGKWYLTDSTRATTLASGSWDNSTGSSASNVWFDETFAAVTVTPNTTYCIIVYYQSSFSVNTTWGGKNSNNYADGSLYQYNGSTKVSTNTGYQGGFKVKVQPPTGYDGKRIVQFSKTDYSLQGSTSWTPTNFPTQLASWDGTFHYAYDSANKDVVKFQISGGSIIVATTTPMLESVYGVLYFNAFVFIVALIGSSLTAIPVTI